MIWTWAKSDVRGGKKTTQATKTISKEGRPHAQNQSSVAKHIRGQRAVEALDS